MKYRLKIPILGFSKHKLKNILVVDGREFLDVYASCNYHITHPTIIVMHSSSIFQQDKEKANTYVKVMEYVDKPISVRDIYRIRDTYFGQ